MESSSGTPHLLTDVRFTVSRKGYDPDEVDNFLERVSAAVAQLQEKLRRATADAEAAEGRAAEATRNQTLLQAKIDRLESDLEASRSQAPVAPAARTADDDASEMSKVLVLAQRTADAAVAEARATASQLVNDAEQEAARIRATARTEAEEESTRRRDSIAEEVQGLEADRERLGGEVSALEGYLSEQRSSLGGALDRIRAVLDDPTALRLSPPPTAVATATSRGSADEPGAPTTGWASANGSAEGRVDDEPDAPGTEAPPSAHDADDDAGEADASEGGDEREQGSPWGAPTGSDDLFAADDPTREGGDDRPAGRSVFDAEGPSGGEEGEGGFGQGDEEADAAMRRFFEADFGDDQRFGR